MNLHLSLVCQVFLKHLLRVGGDAVVRRTWSEYCESGQQEGEKKEGSTRFRKG